ncbi:hypothetical protein PF585_04835 [Lactobacillus delbrueckii]|uniref:hypothetical protein n=1 Tax=Lactobacillus delbrueckii TaxID=1584 RepID=UPI0022EBEF1E|nr:hypothetical protein [Lactobacillus delbrueckii]MDA3801436.1 hypothetical protein [Lactobacillus delbrueckii]
MADKETLDLIETLKANNEELLKQVALLTEQVAYLTNKLYGKSQVFRKESCQPRSDEPL